MDKLIAIAATMAVLTVSTGLLPKVLYRIRIAQMELIQESKASKWGTPHLLSKAKHSRSSH